MPYIFELCIPVPWNVLDVYSMTFIDSPGVTSLSVYRHIMHWLPNEDSNNISMASGIDVQ